MRTLIVTVAGTATRFNRDTEKEVLKCLYYKERPEYTLLYQILAKSDGIDEYIVVGGYLYDQLEVFVEHNLLPFKSKIKLVYNPRYRDYGSGYSLVKGLEAVSEKTDEIIFAEGDLTGKVLLQLSIHHKIYLRSIVNLLCQIKLWLYILMSMIAFIIYMIVGINYCLYRKHLKQSIILLKFGNLFLQNY